MTINAWPVSVNNVWLKDRRGHTFLNPRVVGFRAKVEQKARGLLSHPLSGALDVSIIFFPPDHRHRDLDNLSKATLDAFTHAGVWNDDAQIRRLSLAFGETCQGGSFVIRIRTMEDAPHV